LGTKGKIIVIAFVLMAVLAILAKPHVFTTQRAFAVTPEPYQAYQQALAKGELIFLKFYAAW
jgi:hypothetical protein